MELGLSYANFANYVASFKDKQSSPSLPLQAHSVTLSPTPSTESQNGGSPKNAAAVAAALGAGQSTVTSIHHLFPSPVNANGGGGGGGGRARSKLASTSSLASQVGFLRPHSSSYLSLFKYYMQNYFLR